MVKDKQVRELMKLSNKEESLKKAAMKAGMDPKTARKYLRAGKLPSEMKKEHTWRTRKDPFEEVWPELEGYLKVNPGIQAKTLFEYLQRQYPGRFQDGQRRTLERKVRTWRALEGPAKEVYFPQEHYPGVLSESDFTRMNDLNVTVQGRPFHHMIYHFVLTYSNWETGSICFSESFESLSEGLQAALWELGGVPRAHRVDRLSAAVNNNCNPQEFTARYESLLRHYSLRGEKIQAGNANENGDVEKSHDNFKTAVDQALMLRGSRDFESREEYVRFLRQILAQLNSGRQKRVEEELKALRQLPLRRLRNFKRFDVTVRSSSTIRVQKNVYSVNSRLIGEKVRVYLHADELELWYAQKHIATIPRLCGEGKHRISYRDVIDSLVRKPGAFENYQYREELFPSHRFRVAYDLLKANSPKKASRIYLEILHLAAKESETGVENALKALLDRGDSITLEAVKELLNGQNKPSYRQEGQIEEVSLDSYDELLQSGEAAA